MRATLALTLGSAFIYMDRIYIECISRGTRGSKILTSVLLYSTYLRMLSDDIITGRMAQELSPNCPLMTAFHSGLWLQRLAPLPGKHRRLSRLHVDGCARKSLIGRPTPRPSPDPSLSLLEQHPGNRVGRKIHPFERGGHPRRGSLYLHPVTPRSPPATDPDPSHPLR